MTRLPAMLSGDGHFSRIAKVFREKVQGRIQKRTTISKCIVAFQFGVAQLSLARLGQDVDYLDKE